MFAKIANDFLDKSIDYTQFNSNKVVDSYYSAARNAGSQFILINDLNKFWSLHLKKIFTIPPIVRYAIFTGTGLVTPHTDGGNDSVALNFYLQVGNNDATIFYNKKHPNVIPIPKTNAYNIHELDEVSRFSAIQFDTYLMDVKKIHGILKSGPEDRIIISYRWKHFSFEQIFNSLRVEKRLWSELSYDN